MADSSAEALTTDRLVLARPSAHDVDDLAALHGDARVMRFVAAGRPVPAEVFGQRDLPWLLGPYAPGRGYRVARLRSDGAFVGWFGLRPEPGGRPVLELGYRLRPAMWGQGYATEGARALVDLGFEVGHAKQIWATTMVANTASRHVLDKVGLHHLRTFFADWTDPIPGSELGDVEQALDVEEWRLARAARLAT